MTTTALTGPAASARLIGARTGRRWFDWYAIGFVLVLTATLLADALTAPFSRLSTPAASTAPAQAEAGLALVVVAAAGLFMLAQTFGPLAPSPADACWLLPSPMDRRGVLRRPAFITAAGAAATGAVLGLLALAMAGPYLRLGGQHRSLGAALVLAAVGGAGFFSAAVLAAVLVQPRPAPRARLRAVCAALAAAAAFGAVAAQREMAGPPWFTAGFAYIPLHVAALAAAAGLVVAAGAAWLVRRLLPRFPAGSLRSDPLRGGGTRAAAVTGNLPLLAWIAEDNHWRGRTLLSRPWPQLAPAWTLAWADWRRLARRPGLLVALAATTPVPALAGAAVTGHARGLTAGLFLLSGGIVAGVQGTTATRRDTNDPALRRMLGVDAKAVLAARAALPALLSAGWLTLALVLLSVAGVRAGGPWLLLGPATGPGLAAAALQVARTCPVGPGRPGAGSLLGTVPGWLVTRTVSALIGLAGGYITLETVLDGRIGVSVVVLQLAISLLVLGLYLLLSGRRAR